MKPVVLIPVLALAACASWGPETHKGAPVASAHSARPVPVIARCLQEHATEFEKASVDYREDQTIVTFRGDFAVTRVFSISPDGWIRVWRINRFHPYREAIADCAFTDA